MYKYQNNSSYLYNGNLVAASQADLAAAMLTSCCSWWPPSCERYTQVGSQYYCGQDLED
jgi:hypothetical protein